MSAPQVGDAITTAEELDALPVGAGVVMADIEGSLLAVRDNRYWHALGMDPLTSADLFDISVDPEEGGPIPVTLVYLPGQPPRPERVVKAEALTDAADELDPKDLYEAIDSAAAAKRYLFDRAARIEAGESS